MTDGESFSKRYGYAPMASEISIWEDAPFKFREAVMSSARRMYDWQTVAAALSDALHILPPKEKRYDFGKYVDELGTWRRWSDVLSHCSWPHVYDFLECLSSRQTKDDQYTKYDFQQEINARFLEHGIGWQLKDGKILARAQESFERAVSEAKKALEHAGMPTAQSEIDEAIRDLSRRPEPDLTGAITHSMGALECAAKQISGKPKMTLGEIINGARSGRIDLTVPEPLLTCIEKAWGYASGHGRHLLEGRDPGRAEAQLIVHISAAVVAYLCRGIPSATNKC